MGSSYLREGVTLASTNLRRASLRSADHGDLVITRTRTRRLGTRRFYASAPAVWNALPHAVVAYLKAMLSFQKTSRLICLDYHTASGFSQRL